MKPYYEDDAVAIYHADARLVMPHLSHSVLVTDPPYGIAYKSGAMRQASTPDSIKGDGDTSLRDEVLAVWGARPALVFGSWRKPVPDARMMLVWDQGGALGMGALDLPWKPSWQGIYVLGGGFEGRRDGAVLRFPPIQAMAYNGRVHPHEKPVPLMRALVGKCPPGLVIDPFCGSGSTLRAAKDLGRKAVGIEIEERYCEIAARRMGQEVLAIHE